MGAQQSPDRSAQASPPEVSAFAALLDTQPAPATTWLDGAFHWFLCLAMADRGVLRLVETHASADGRLLAGTAATGEATNAVRP